MVDLLGKKRKILECWPLKVQNSVSIISILFHRFGGMGYWDGNSVRFCYSAQSKQKWTITGFGQSFWKSMGFVRDPKKLLIIHYQHSAGNFKKSPVWVREEYRPWSPVGSSLVARPPEPGIDSSLAQWEVQWKNVVCWNCFVVKDRSCPPQSEEFQTHSLGARSRLIDLWSFRVLPRGWTGPLTTCWTSKQ